MRPDDFTNTFQPPLEGTKTLYHGSRPNQEEQSRRTEDVSKKHICGIRLGCSHLDSTQRKQTGSRVIKPKKAALVKQQQMKKVSFTTVDSKDFVLTSGRNTLQVCPP